MKTIQAGIALLADLGFDYKYGTNTTAMTELDALDIPSENKRRGKPYHPTRVISFRNCLKRLAFPRDYVFVDLGAGRGRVLMLAAEYGFRRVIGIEFSHQLCEEARRNIARYQSKSSAASLIAVIESDVTAYPLSDEENVFFMFNPFDDVILSKVLDKLVASYQSNPRPMWVIYHNPAFPKVIEASPYFSNTARYPSSGHDFSIYAIKSPAIQTCDEVVTHEAFSQPVG